MSYSRILVHYPQAILVIVSIFAVTCLVIIVTLTDLPDFSDPKLGFEARGTDLSNRIRSHALLLEKTSSYQPELPTPAANLSSLRSLTDVVNDSYDDIESNRDFVHNISLPSSFFCDVPRKEYARIVYQAKNGHSLFTLQNIKSMCKLEEDKIRSLPEFSRYCVEISPHDHRCCPNWSLGNYIAMLNGKPTCSSITEEDVLRVLNLLKDCHQYFKNRVLTANCFQEDQFEVEYHCPEVPRTCAYKNAVYHILHYLLDIKFMAGNTTDAPNVTYAMTFFPLAAGLALEELYIASGGIMLEDHNVQVLAVDFGIKQIIFDKYLSSDTVWSITALVAVFLCMWIYTTSLFITIMTVASIILTLEISYFLYTLVFTVPFFPFMNLMTVVILIGIGADDVFIYCKSWKCAKLKKDAATLEKLVTDTLKHASLSMFVTSFTTASAFFANYISNIPALSCFAIFAGTAVMINFLFMVTWVPAVIVMHEKWCSNRCMCCCMNSAVNKTGFLTSLRNLCCKITTHLLNWSQIFYEKMLPFVVIKFRFIWLAVFGLLGAAAIVIIFYYPRLKLPSSNDFQVFSDQHPFEVYDFKIKSSFWFEKTVGDYAPTMPLTVVWGIEATDTGNRLDPFDEGQLVSEKEFNIAAPESQSWLLEFCRSLRMTNLYQQQPGLQLSNCFIEHFRKFMMRGCEGINGEVLECCQSSGQFPFPEHVFKKCIYDYLTMLAKSSHLDPGIRTSGLRFSKESREISGLIVEFYSNELFSFNYQNMENFYSTMDTFVKQELQNAPAQMMNGWFVSYLDFFDLQNSIAKGTPIAIGVSLGIASFVAFITTLNVLITIYAMISIAASIFLTVASLVLLGWELDILESVTITVAIGLSVDFPLHYGMAYRLSPHEDRHKRVFFSISLMASPVTMSCFTTFLAGLIMMPATVLVYKQLATFLMLVMPISWVYSTFFFLGLLSAAGPENDFGQFRWPNHKTCTALTGYRGETICSKSEYCSTRSATKTVANAENHDTELVPDQNNLLCSHHHDHRHQQQHHVCH